MQYIVECRTSFNIHRRQRQNSDSLFIIDRLLWALRYNSSNMKRSEIIFILHSSHKLQERDSFTTEQFSTTSKRQPETLLSEISDKGLFLRDSLRRPISNHCSNMDFHGHKATDSSLLGRTAPHVSNSFRTNFLGSTSFSQHLRYSSS